MMASYIGVIVFLMGYTITLVIMGERPELLPTLAKFELLGIAAIQDMTRYWTTAELNGRLLPLEGNLLINRAFVVTLGAAMLAATVLLFSTAERAPSKRRLRKLAKAEARDAARYFNMLREIDSRYGVILEMGFGCNFTHELIYSNSAMNEVHGNPTGVLHLGFGLLPYTQYHLDIICPGIRLKSPLGQELLGPNAQLKHLYDDSGLQARVHA